MSTIHSAELKAIFEALRRHGVPADIHALARLYRSGDLKEWWTWADDQLMELREADHACWNAKKEMGHWAEAAHEAERKRDEAKEQLSELENRFADVFEKYDMLEEYMEDPRAFKRKLQEEADRLEDEKNHWWHELRSSEICMNDPTKSQEEREICRIKHKVAWDNYQATLKRIDAVEHLWYLVTKRHWELREEYQNIRHYYSTELERRHNLQEEVKHWDHEASVAWRQFFEIKGQAEEYCQKADDIRLTLSNELEALAVD